MAKPFIKWVGGKTQLLEQLEKHTPEKFGSYFEPFLGGGALFFALKPEKAVINDLNSRLINLYRFLRNDIDKLVSELKFLESKYLVLNHEQRKDFYYKMRDIYNSTQDESIRQSAILLFLNKTCFNGIYRENSKGEFNVPFGKNNMKSLFDIEQLREASLSLQSATILNGSYQESLLNVQAGDFVYLDPPYFPLSATSSFTKYTGDDFGYNAQLELRDTFIKLHNQGCYVMLSNSDAKEVRELYKDFKQYEVLANRALNCKANGRGKIKELIITSY